MTSLQPRNEPSAAPQSWDAIPASHRPGFPSLAVSAPPPPSGFCLRTTLTSDPASADSGVSLLHCISPRISAVDTAAVGLKQTPTRNAAKSPPTPTARQQRGKRGMLYISTSTQTGVAEGERHRDGRPRAARPGAPSLPSDTRYEGSWRSPFASERDPGDPRGAATFSPSGCCGGRPASGMPFRQMGMPRNCT